MAILFTPLQLRGIQLKNRIVMSPMCQYSAEDGFANDWHLVHLGSRAVGGVGMIIQEATAVSPQGRITLGDLGIWKDEHIDFLKRITVFIEKQGVVPGIQLAHAGRKASHHLPWKGGNALNENEGAWLTEAPSNIPFKEGNPEPKALTSLEINQTISDFIVAAQRAVTAGFKVIEIHAAHGYLLHEFMSPLSNKRTDAWGGPFENRIKLTVQVTEAIRKVIPDNYPLLVRISATDWVEGGWNIIDSVALAKVLKQKGADLIDCSTGGNVQAKIPTGPLYQVPFAEQIKKESGILTGAVGMITTAAEAEEILAKGQADIVLLARQLLRDPYFALKAAKELNGDISWPKQYERAK